MVWLGRRCGAGEETKKRGRETGEGKRDQAGTESGEGAEFRNELGP
jgi:hypothetical protein